ncbi:hypothetical protein M011DRAFT_399972 [Sporormia fimetaria CBS 119925]|uniref:Exonuclease domain-containing protein n=1 Tax=Sporormia fimetaria CBS 119925 TaxID=1340428 RepID=A0A6A6VHJ5_9PLEO|nr:hypothetical protein M011DRAFT_399972 [Sporormia fimetaria CBS 119925]
MGEEPCPCERSCKLFSCPFHRTWLDPENDYSALDYDHELWGDAEEAGPSGEYQKDEKQSKPPSAHPNTETKRGPPSLAIHTTLPASAQRPISPPRRIRCYSDLFSDSKPAAPPVLEPALLRTTKSPAAHMTRRTVVLNLHAAMTEMNKKVASSTDSMTKIYALDDQELVRRAVAEEKEFAEMHAATYKNFSTSRLLAYRKMSLPDWIQLAQKIRAGSTSKAILKSNDPVTISPTGLSVKDELEYLKTLVLSEERRKAHGFVMSQPSPSEVQDAEDTLRCAAYWEKCERCGSRFQVFPDRRPEDGALTSGGKCRFHPEKSYRGPDNKQRLKCCSMPPGSDGCFVCHSHVFKVPSADIKRLAYVMPFVPTPAPDKDLKEAFCLDCEMGYTTNGMELIRLTVVSWPTYLPVLDILVTPLGPVLDLNTRFSGVTQKQFINAKPYDPKNPTTDPAQLQKVDSPAKARELLFNLIGPSTPLIGHALENDMNVLRMIHPTIVDTVALFPHARGLPYRRGLKDLANVFLKVDIQNDAAKGHNSYEDAKVAGQLVHWHIKHKICKKDYTAMSPKAGSKRKATVEDDPDDNKRPRPNY